jgi:hypothetical protein
MRRNPGRARDGDEGVAGASMGIMAKTKADVFTCLLLNVMREMRG